MSLQKIFIYLLASFSGAVSYLFSAHPVLAQFGEYTGLREWIVNPIQWQTLPQAVRGILNIAFAVAGIVAVVFLIIGGFRYVTAGGNVEAADQAKTTILNSIIGLVVIFIAFLLVNYLLAQFGFSPATY